MHEMLHNITWEQFLTFTAILMAIYYGYIIVAYFRKDIMVLAARPPEKKSGTNPLPAGNHAGLPQSGINTYDIHISTVHELMDELNNIFRKCASQDFKKPEFLMAVQLKLGSYPQIKGTPFQVSVTNHIETEALSKCGIRLEEEELQSLW